MSISVEVVVTLGAVLVALIHFLQVLVLRPKSLKQNYIGRVYISFDTIYKEYFLLNLIKKGN